MDLFISDTHFDHYNIMGYDGRPFSSTEEMNQELTKRWNERVTDSDNVYILGDFVWTKDKDYAAKIVKGLNGHKHLIIGNHDQVFTRNRKYFLKELIEEMVDYKELFIESRNAHIVMSHYPMPFFKNMYHGWYHFYGHVHSTPEWDCCENLRRAATKVYDEKIRMANVGCMMTYMDYGPRSFAALDNYLFDLYDHESAYKPETSTKKEE